MATATKKSAQSPSASTTSKPKAKSASKPTAKTVGKEETQGAAAKAPAKSAATKAAGSKPAAKAKTAKPPTLTPEQRRCYVEVAAYYIAERRGFHGGSELDDWIQAEAEIDRLLQEGVLKP
ncbi:MAG: DUF2934 domain-containing protein [Rhodocyclaceae bacterium]|nr:DUF2934 domain-containing protein [Rhodocyclaceae bacterium]